MKREGVNIAYSSDHHFEQAGFQYVLKGGDSKSGVVDSMATKAIRATFDGRSFHVIDPLTVSPK